MREEMGTCMVEEADASADADGLLGGGRRIEVEVDVDLGFGGLAGDGGASGHGRDRDKSKRDAPHRDVMLPSLRLLRRLPRPPPPSAVRPFFSFFRKQPPPNSLAQDNLFHPFSKSPIPAIRARADAVQSLAPCPICAASHDILHAQPRAVRFECPDCGWPTHCSEEHWKDDAEHHKYCRRLREANEDEHDLRSGRRMREFELPGACVPCFESDRCRNCCRTAGI